MKPLYRKAAILPDDAHRAMIVGLIPSSIEPKPGQRIEIRKADGFMACREILEISYVHVNPPPPPDSWPVAVFIDLGDIKLDGQDVQIWLIDENP